MQKIFIAFFQSFFGVSVFMDYFTHFSYNKGNVKGLFLKGEQIYGTSK